MKKLAFGVYVVAALFGLFGAIVLRNAPLDARQLSDGYGVGEATTAVNYVAVTASVETTK